VGVEVKVRTGSSREGIGGEHDGAVVIRVAARPVEGKANAAVRKLVAKKLGVRASRVEILRGGRTARKVIAVEGMNAARLRAALLG
jgi:uncharacterized protein YggU (UPF0235/DUF167 family)